MSTIEYKTGKGVIEQRDPEIGKIETQKRKDFLSSILPQLRNLLITNVGDIFHFELTGSVKAELATPDSDIDIFVLPRSNTTEYQKNILVIESLKAMQTLKEDKTINFLYNIELWFGTEKNEDELLG